MTAWRNLRLGIVALPIAGSTIFGSSGLSAAASSTSAANTPASLIHHMAIKYHNSWLFKSRSLRRCITIRTHGTITYTTVNHPNPRNPPPTITFERIKLANPVVTATVTRLSARGRCGSRTTVSKLSLGQHWTGYACGFNPSISVSFPWGVSLGGWPNCGDRRQAGYTTSYGRGSFFEQSNSGSPTRFGDVTISFQQAAPSYGVVASVVAYVGTRSDSFGASNGASARKAGLRKP